MNAETINETINVCKYVAHERKMKMIDGEVILPDIKPNILSIVKITRDVCISKKIIEDNMARIEGCLDICVIYIADDESNSVRGVSSQINFSELIDVNGIDEKSIIKLKYDIGNLEYKVINGRKIAIRAPIGFELKVFKNLDINIIKDINGDNMQMLKTYQNLCGPILRNHTDVQLNENIKLSENNSPIGEILNSSISISNKEYKFSYNKILAKAEAKVKIIYIADNDAQSIETFETTIPVMGFIDVDGITEENKVSIDYEIKEFSVRPTYQDLQSNAISIDACIEVSTYSFINRDVELLTDFYIPTAVINAETQNVEVLNNLLDVKEYIEITQTLVVPDLDNTNILELDGILELNERNILNGKIAVAGNMAVNILFTQNDKHIIENKKIDLPFQQVVRIEEISKEMNPMIHMDIETMNYNIVGENQIQVTIKIIIDVVAEDNMKINSITNLAILNEEVPHMPSIIVYYVKWGDTLWNIAKKFRNTIEHIKEMNDLSDDIIYPGQRLLISKLQVENDVNSLM